MTQHRNLNFVPHADRLGLLQAGALIALIASAAMTGILLHGTRQQSASIADTSGTPTTTPIGGERSVAVPKAISENAATGVALGRASDSVRYYEQQTGKAFSFDLATRTASILSDRRLSGFITSYWLPGTDQVISSFQQPSGVAYRFFDYQTSETNQIGTAVDALAVAPDGQHIVYLETNDAASALFVGTSDGSVSHKLIDTRAQDVQLDWPCNTMISMLSQRLDRTGSDLSLIDPSSGDLTVLMTNRENLEYQWSPDGTKLLFSYYTSAQGISLWERDISSGNEVSLGVATSAQKCAWQIDGITVVCGVPVKSSLTRGVSAAHSATIDDIVTLNTRSGEQTVQYHGTSTMPLGTISPLVSSSGAYFVFTNVFDQRLYSFPL
jgi:hypothetical protein